MPYLYEQWRYNGLSTHKTHTHTFIQYLPVSERCNAIEAVKSNVGKGEGWDLHAFVRRYYQTWRTDKLDGHMNRQVVFNRSHQVIVASTLVNGCIIGEDITENQRLVCGGVWECLRTQTLCWRIGNTRSSHRSYWPPTLPDCLPWLRPANKMKIKFNSIAIQVNKVCLARITEQNENGFTF